MMENNVAAGETLRLQCVSLRMTEKIRGESG